MAKTATKEQVEETLTPTGPENVDELVDALLGEIRGIKVKCNPERTLAVVDVASRNSHQGVQYRQVYVELKPYGIDVTLREGFKSSHGGMDQMKTLHGFSVPSLETVAYTKLFTRFFNYNRDRNVKSGTLFLNELQRTSI